MISKNFLLAIVVFLTFAIAIFAQPFSITDDNYGQTTNDFSVSVGSTLTNTVTWSATDTITLSATGLQGRSGFLFITFDTAATVELLPEDLTVTFAGMPVQAIQDGPSRMEYHTDAVANIPDLGTGGTISYMVTFNKALELNNSRITISASGEPLVVSNSLSHQITVSGDHDLIVRGVELIRRRYPLACPSKVCALLLAMGERDYELQSGQVTISFYHQCDRGPWIDIGEIPVTWGALEPGLAKYQSWPQGGGQNGNCIEFTPCSAGNCRFRAEVVHPTGIQDANPSDNTGESAVYSIAETCSLLKCSGPCVLEVRKISEFGQGVHSLWCSALWPPPNLCEQYPPLCEFPNVCELFPGLCPTADICKFIQCPFPSSGQIEVLFDNRVNGMNAAIVNSAGRILARGETLSRPIRERDIAYNQRLVFQVSPDQTYYLAFWPSKETKLGASLPFPMRVNLRR